MCPGVPLSDCAIIRPLVSNKPQARSWLSRTMVLNAVRMSASCCSLATDKKRLQMTSKVTGSIALLSIAQLHDHIEAIVHAGAPSHADDQCRLVFLHDGRSGECHPRLARVAMIPRRVDKTLLFGKVSGPRAFARIAPASCIARQLEIHFRPRSTRNHAPVDDFQGHVRPFATIECLVRLFER